MLEPFDWTDEPEKDYSQFDRTETRESHLLARLHEAVLEVDPICTQAPNIWDAENYDDMRFAKRQCKGQNEAGEVVNRVCPLLEMCGFTSIAIKEVYGVWGGMSPFDRRKIIYSHTKWYSKL
jgi:hypothetical protein